TLVLAAALLIGALPSSAAPRPPDDARVESLLKKMTLEEKLGQLQQLGGPIEGNQELLDLAAAGKLGSTLNVRRPKTLNALQRAAVEKSRLHVPLLFGFDVIHGYRTVFPIPLALAAGWDPALVEGASRRAAREAYDDGLRWTFSPMVDVARDPRWGRVAEGAGEDPYLGAALARAYVRGYQTADPSAPGTLAACAKHWVGYGAAEAGRDYSTTEISERTLREVYFPPFRAAADAGALTFMSAFNDLDGVPASANKWTLTDVLRGEFGFRGFVVSDWDSVAQLIDHGVAADGAEAARRGLTAGVDMEMDSRLYGAQLPGLLKAGKVSLAQVDEAVRRILSVKARLGLFERPYADESRASGAPDAEARAAARAAAARSLVLLKNDGTLPFRKSAKTVAVIGPLGDDGAGMLGSWSGDGRAEEATTLAAGLRAVLPGATVTFSTGCPVNGESDAGFADALAAAKAADAVVLALGEAGDMSGEASSRASLDLPGRQLDLAKAALALGKPTAVVLFNGRPLTIPWLAENAPAILEAWQPGTEGGRAVADALFGDAVPGGKLTMTFPRVLGQVPLYYAHKNTGRPFDAANHYTSKYIDAPNDPQYPFGHGLSYTTFALSGLKLSAERIRRDGRVEAAVTVENTGKRAGDEVVQLYLRRKASSVTPPVRALKGFARVTLAPGEKRTLAFALTSKELGFVGLDQKWTVEPGAVEVFAGTSSVGGLRAVLTIAP
ncbi:MAG: beta-glucosidase BglX, partial [Elusimicrobia bacterium]|nr:beta-glucosidase BglX [Elusimicrobiota bacterium]